MKKRNITILVALLMVAVFAVSGCAGGGGTAPVASAEAATPAEEAAAPAEEAAAPAEEATPAAEAAAPAEAPSASGEPMDIVYLTPSTESQYWQQVGLGVENAILDLQEKEGATINYSIAGPATEAESDAYIKAFENVIAKKPDGIVTATLTPDATGPVTQAASEQGIYVNFASMGIDQEQWGEYYGAHYYCDNSVIGEVAAQAMLDALKAKGIEPKGKIGVHMSVVVPVLEYRMSAFKEYLAKNAPDIECLDTLYNENDVNNAQANVENQLATYTDLIGLYGANNISGDGIALAIQNANASDKVCGVAVDADDLEVEALGEGDLDAIVAQTPYEQGYSSVMDLYKSITTGEMPAEQEVNIAPQAVTKANMKDEAFAALLNPFILKRS